MKKNLKIVSLILLGFILLTFRSEITRSQGAPFFTRSSDFSAIANSVDIPIPAGVNDFKLSWNTRGGLPTACTVRLMGGNTSGTYATTLVSAQTCTSDSFSIIFTGGVSHARIEMTAYTNPTGGITTVTLDTWKEISGVFGGAVNPGLYVLNQAGTANLAVNGLAAGADAVSNTEGSAITDSLNYAYNGATWDRLRTGLTTGASMTTGLLASGSYHMDSGSQFTPNGSIRFTADAGDGSQPQSVSSVLYNGTTWDRIRSANGADNTTGTGLLGTNPLLWGGVNYRRLSAISSLGDADSGVGTQANANVVFNGTTYDRVRGNQSDQVAGTGMLNTIPMLLDGSNLSRHRSASLANFTIATTLTSRNSIGVQLVEKPSRFSVISNPAAGSQATASIAAEASVRHVVDCVSFSAAANAAPAATLLTVNVRDGATGAGTVIWTWQIEIVAAIGQDVAPHSLCGLNLTGTTNTAMTVEFSAALANLVESVSFSGFNIN